MSRETRKTDSKGRVALPHGFAGTTVIVEQVSESEVRIRKAQVIPEDELFDPEGSFAAPLSDRDRDAFLAALDNPPAPNAALRRAAAGQKKDRRG